MNEQPPWTDALLHLVLKRADRECVSGDLLEVYREEIVPARGRESADAWYARQVFGYVWRSTTPWAVVFSLAFLARNTYDWLVPTTNFMVRSTVSTTVGVSVLLCVGFWAAWRSGSAVAGIVVTVLTSQIAAVFSATGVALTLAMWHDAETLRAIDGSGGLGEAFVLPFMAIVPAMIMGAAGGVLGMAARHTFDSTARVPPARPG